MLLVDTSVWSLALRRDAQASEPQVQQLQDALLGSDVVVTTGLVLQELLQGFAGPKAREQMKISPTLQSKALSASRLGAPGSGQTAAATQSTALTDGSLQLEHASSPNRSP